MSDGGFIRPEPVLRGEDLHPYPLSPAIEEILSMRREIERLRGLIIAYYDAEDAAEGTESESRWAAVRDANCLLRKAVGR